MTQHMALPDYEKMLGRTLATGRGWHVIARAWAERQLAHTGRSGWFAVPWARLDNARAWSISRNILPQLNG
jgi:hypothetical protein